MMLGVSSTADAWSFEAWSIEYKHWEQQEPSREAAAWASPGRKPWERSSRDASPVGAAPSQCGREPASRPLWRNRKIHARRTLPTLIHINPRSAGILYKHRNGLRSRNVSRRDIGREFRG